jgi:putative endonuclease
MYCAYVLRSVKNGRFYTGSTEDWKRRFAEHNDGRSKATKYLRPFEILLVEEFDSKVQAVRRERYLKSGLGRQELTRLLKRGGIIGPVDQLGDRLHGMEKAVGSSPIRSNNSLNKPED